MSKYKVGDKVKVVRITGINPEGRRPYIGETFTVDSVNPNGSHIGEHYGVEGKCIYIFFVDELEPYVEEKKMFTKSDLKTGMFGVMDNGFKFVVVNDHFVYSNGEWDRVSSLDDDLAMYSKKIMKVFEGIDSFNILNFALDVDYSFKPNPIYDRERDTKKLYNGKVVCVDNCANKGCYTVGKIYQFKDGAITCDDGFVINYDGHHNKFYSFEDFANFSGSKFIEVVE
jgi:hypothetical protein